MVLATILVLLGICGCVIMKNFGYKVYHKDWIISKEEEWMSQLEDYFEQMYQEDFVRLLDEKDCLIEEIEYLKGLNQEANYTQKRIHLSFSHFLYLLVEDSFSEPFENRFSTRKSVQNFYNNSLLKVIELVENDFDLSSISDSISYPRRRIMKLLESNDKLKKAINFVKEKIPMQNNHFKLPLEN